MAQYIKVNEAERNIPNYKNYPNIDKSGSLRGMQNRFGWDLKYVVQIGGYYYNLKNYSAAQRYF